LVVVDLVDEACAGTPRPGLHHHITGGIGYDVIIGAWWASQ